ncbi:hypothetical protein [Anaerovibrio lipolyticus]|uniref:hypothetical protein n=1 Tax=Anaerovibrio lipolyticus TaxID=82374 RepID=UPI0023F1D32D|nr:hypothetical protein [Anaerovibrio lipolyticus]
MEKTTTTTLKPFVLYKEDFEELQQYLPNDGLTIQYYSNDEEYSFESIEEMLNILNGKELSSLSLSYIGPSFKVILEDYGSYIVTIGTPDIETLGRISAVEKICNRHRWHSKYIFNSKIFDVFSLLAILSILVITGLRNHEIITPETFEYCKFIPIVLFLIYTVGAFAKFSQSCFKGCFYYYNDRPKGFLSRITKLGLEEVFKGLIIAGITWILSYL